MPAQQLVSPSVPQATPLPKQPQISQPLWHWLALATEPTGQQTRPPQQSPGPVQAEPTLRPVQQNPLLQSLWQQSALVPQVCPFGAQQVLATQAPPQQSLGWSQLEPAGWQQPPSLHCCPVEQPARPAQMPPQLSLAPLHRPAQLGTQHAFR